MPGVISRFRTFMSGKWKTKLLVFPALVFFTWFVSIAVAPYSKIKDLQNLVNNDSTLIKNNISVYDYAEMKHLLGEKAYLEALLKLAENDSIQLVINLADSTVNLSIKGVIIHQTRIYEFSIDKFFKKITGIQANRLFSQPLLVQSAYSSIVKEPVVVRHAPKDTLEAALQAWQPDTLVQNPAFAALSIEHNLQIILEQDKNISCFDKRKKLGFHYHLLFRKAIASLENFVCFKKQEYQAAITIKMPDDDLRAIYRALPSTTYIVVKIY
jgi:hypothetical protein